LARKRVGDNIAFTIFRNGKTMRISVKLLRAPFDRNSF
jgi:hypothetical protein